MDAIIEKELSKFKTHIIDNASLKNIFLKKEYVNINDKIYRLKKEGILIPLKKGLYFHNSPLNKTIISKEIISNVLLGPSYISLDYALSYHGLIPESVHEVTGVTTKRSKSYSTRYGLFSYKHTKKELFPIGLILEEAEAGNFIIASKEKALCDKIYFTNNVTISSQKKMFEFIGEDLRIDIEELESFDVEIVSEYYNITRSKKIKLFLNFIKSYDFN